MNSQHRSAALSCAAAAITTFLIFAAPQASRDAAVQGLALCGGSLLLGIFPFLVVSNLVVSSGCADALAIPFWPAARLLGGHSKDGAAALLLGALGGFAPAAAAVSGLYRQGRLDKTAAELLLAAAAGSSPSFVILSVGGQMLGRTGLGVRLYLCQLAAAYASVLVYRLLTQRGGRRLHPAPLISDPPPDQPRPSVPAAIGDAALTYVRLCGFVIYFRILTGACTALLPQKTAILPALFLEVSTGCSLAAGLPVYAVYGCCAALSVQSISVLLQLRAICPPELSLRPLLLIRPLHLVLSLGLLRLSLSGDQAETVFNSLEARVVTLPRLPMPAGLLLFALCLLLCDQLSRTLQTAQKRL